MAGRNHRHQDERAKREQRVRGPAPADPRTNDNGKRRNRRARAGKEIRRADQVADMQRRGPHQNRAVDGDVAQFNDREDRGRPANPPPTALITDSLARARHGADHQVRDPAQCQHLQTQREGAEDDRQQIEVAQEPDQSSILEIQGPSITA